MGTDKFENEHLIEWGLPTDVWFHVERMSSAHAYLRLPRGVAIATLADAVAGMPKGDVHHAWSIAAAARSKPAVPLEDPVHKQRAVAGLRAKHAAKGLPPPGAVEGRADAPNRVDVAGRRGERQQ